MISDIRAYFDARVKDIDPTLIAWEEDLFGNNDQSEVREDKYYNLVIGTNTPTRDGNSHWDNFSVLLDIYAQGERDFISAYDAAYDKAIQIKNCIIDWKNYDGVFNDIEFTLAEPIEDDTNDFSVKMRLNFIVRLNYNFS